MFSAGDIADLEKKYSKYVLKRIFKIILFIIIFILFMSSVAYYLVTNSAKIKPNKKINVKIEKKDTLKKTTPKVNSIIKKITRLEDLNTTSKILEKNISKVQEKIVVESKVDKKLAINMKKIKDKKVNQIIFHIKPSNDLSFEDSPRQLLFLNIVNPKKNIKQINDINTNKNIDKNDTIKVEEVSTPKIKIVMQDIDSVKYLKNKYENTHNIIFALMLCEEYYSKKDYNNSLKWSIIANDIDNQSERSWIWFAKSKFKLGKKDDAIKALKAFLRTNQSNTVKLLLDSIENGSLND